MELEKLIIKRDSLKEELGKLNDKIGLLTPMKVILHDCINYDHKVKSLTSTPEYYCPYCGEIPKKYCKKHKCGQMLDWSGLDEQNKDSLINFLEYYKEECQTFINNHETEYFKNWYETTCNEMLQAINNNIHNIKLDTKVLDFIKLYKFYINLAKEQENDEVLLENFFTIPTRICKELLEEKGK